MDDFGLLVGRYHATLPTISTDQCLSELVLDSNGRLIISGRWLEDAPHNSGDAGIFSLGVRDDGVFASVVYDTVTFTADNGGLAGNDIDLVFDGNDDIDTVVNAWNAANPENTVSFTGQAGTYVPSAGTAALAGGTSDTVFTSDNYDYSPIAVDKYGRLKVIADLDVDFDYVYAEDSAHASGDQGAFVLGVRQDTLASSTSADGDYAAFKVNAKGELYVKDADVLAELLDQGTTLDSILSDTNAMVVDLAAIEVELLDQGTTLDSILSDTNAMVVDLAAIEVELLDQGTTLDSILSDTNAMVVDLAAIEVELLDQGTTLDSILVDTSSIDDTLTALSKAEDSVHSSGDQGIMSLAVRNDAGTALAADGDYIPLMVDSNGALYTVVAPVGSEQYSVTDALAAAGDGLETITSSGTPWVTVASYANGAGQTVLLYGYQWACDDNAQMRIVTDDTSDIKVYKTDINSSAMPGTSESWSDGGRIEIPGSADQVVKLQIKKRQDCGSDGHGTGSLHIRVI